MNKDANRKNSRTLVATIAIVTLALTIAAVSIPNLLRSRIAANEASAVGSIRTIDNALATYSAEHPGEGYPQKLSDLAPYVGPVLAGGIKSGYSFGYTPDSPDFDGVVKSFRVDAAPLTTQTGIRRFSANESGQIKYKSGSGQIEASLTEDSGQPNPPQRTGESSRAVTRQGSFCMIVSTPIAVSEKIRTLAYRLGGYSEATRYSDESGNATETSIAIRVPAEKYEEARREIRGFGERIRSEQDVGRDVTAQYVDLESHLRNYRAEEEQYLEIMRRAGNIKDTLAVSERLAEVRGHIERVQGQINLLSHQTKMALIEISLRTEDATTAVEVHWRPIAEIKTALGSAAHDLSTYVDFMIAVLFRLPVFALWSITAFMSLWGGWRLLRWTWKRFFSAPTLATGALQQ